MSTITICSPLLSSISDLLGVSATCSINFRFLTLASEELFEALLVKFEIANPKSILGKEGVVDTGVTDGVEGYTESIGGVACLTKGFCKAAAKN